MSQKFKAVVIDDVELCRTFLVDFLEERGYQVDNYASAESFVCLSSAAGRCPVEDPCADFLLTDNRMPLLTGLQFIERQQARGCKLAVASLAVISGSWTREERNKAKQLGCRTFDKPYDLKGIDAWLSRCEKSA